MLSISEMMGSVFSTTTESVDVAISPLESVTVAVQVMVSPTSVSVSETVYESLVLTTLVPTVHSYVGVIEPSSASDAVAEHVSSVLVYAFVGEIEASTSNTGGVLPMVRLAVSLMDALLLSVKETVQVMVSSGPEILESSCRVASLPSVELVVSFVHSYVGDRVPSFRSVPAAEHVSSSVTVAVVGEMVTEPMVGSVF